MSLFEIYFKKISITINSLYSDLNMYKYSTTWEIPLKV